MRTPPFSRSTMRPSSRGLCVGQPLLAVLDGSAQYHLAKSGQPRVAVLLEPNFASARDSGYYRHAKFFGQGDDVPLPVRWRYKLDRWRSQLAEMFHSEPQTLRPRLW